MSYVGLDPQTPLLNTSTEFFSGNAVNMQFTLSRSVASASDLDVMIGNVAQRPFADYTAQNLTLLFATAPASGTDNITVTYRAGALISLDLAADAFPAGTVGAPGLYSVAANNTGIYWPSATNMTVTVAGSNRVSFTSAPESTSTTTGVIQIAGGAGITGNINAGGLINFSNATESTSVSTGALKVAGGAGIAGNLNIGGDITCVGDFTVNGTFTTTGTDSLEVADPFIFLANANPGDTYDTGIVSEYYDGAITRYTGYFRDITDNKYKLFGNLSVKPTTTVDTSDASFQYQDLILSNLSATGNVTGTYLIGNGSLLTGISSDATRILNANSTVIIPGTNSNVLVNVNGVTIGTFSSSGLGVSGTVSATGVISAAGNVIGSNIDTAGLVTATGNVTSAGNVSGGNLITGGRVVSTGNVVGGNITTTGQVTAGANITGGNIKTAGLVSATGDIYGNNFSATTAVDAVGNITGGNLITGGAVEATTGITVSTGGISALGNIIGGNVNTGILSLSGNVISPINTTSAITTTANIDGGNIISSALLRGTTLSALGTVTFSGTTSTISIGTSQTTGTTTIGGAAQTGVINLGRSTATQTLNIANGVTSSTNVKTVSIGENGALGSTTTIAIGAALGTGSATFNAATPVTISNTSGSALSVAGNVTGGNVQTGGAVSATGLVTAGGNITGANFGTAGLITATGNVVGGNINTAGLVSVGGTIVSVGNITGGNVLTTGFVSAGGTISGTGNITGGNINTAGLVSATGNVTNGIANVLTGNAIVTTLVQGATVSATGTVIGSAVQTGTLSLSGNVLSGINSTSTITTTANVSGGNFIGTLNGSGANVTSINATNISSGTLAQARLANSSLTVNGVSITLGGSGTVTATATNALTIGTGLSGTSYNGSSPVTITNTGVTALTGGGGISVSASTGSITLGSTATSSNTAGAIVARGASGEFSAGVITATATSARYADLAEMYCADADYAPGTVLVFGGDQEVTVATEPGDTRIAGVVSTNPAHLMNSTLECDCAVALALTGRVPTQVIGPVRKGDMMVSAGNGWAMACATPVLGSVIGKALENFTGDQGTIEIVVGRL